MYCCGTRCIAVASDVSLWHQMYRCGIRCIAVASDVLLWHQIYSIRFIASASEISILVYLYLCCLICFIWLGRAPEQCKLKTVQSERDWFVSIINTWCFRRGDCKGSNWDQVGWMAQRNWTSLVLTVDVLKQNVLNKIQYKHYYRIMNVTFNLYSVPPPPSAIVD